MRRITTTLPTLYLAELTACDAADYYRLIDRNRDHLTQHGDYQELGRASLQWVQAALSDPADHNEKFGIWLEDELIGRADLSPRAAGHVVLGYWLGKEYTGRGYATIACRALLLYGREQLHVTDVFAGVTKGNRSSEAVLNRLGFRVLEDRGSYTLFHLKL